MLKMNTVGSALATVATGTAVEQSTSPYLPGTTVVTVIKPAGLTGTCAIQGSDDNSTWADLHSSGAITTNNEVQFKEVVLKKYIRSNVTVRSAGSVSMFIMNAG